MTISNYKFVIVCVVRAKKNDLGYSTASSGTDGAEDTEKSVRYRTKTSVKLCVPQSLDCSVVKKTEDAGGDLPEFFSPREGDSHQMRLAHLCGWIPGAILEGCKEYQVPIFCKGTWYHNCGVFG